MSKPPCCFQKQERAGKAFFCCRISAYTKKIEQTDKNLYFFLSRQHRGRYNYLKQAYGALQWMQKELHGYHWFRIRLCQRKEILPLLLSTVHWHGFLISGDPQAFTPACKCTLFPHRKHEFKYLCVWLSLPVPTLISCELLRAELFKKGK